MNNGEFEEATCKCSATCNADGLHRRGLRFQNVKWDLSSRSYENEDWVLGLFFLEGYSFRNNSTYTATGSRVGIKRTSFINTGNTLTITNSTLLSQRLKHFSGCRKTNILPQQQTLFVVSDASYSRRSITRTSRTLVLEVFLNFFVEKN